MKLYDKNGTEYNAIVCKLPQMQDQHRGRTWDSIDKTIDGQKYSFALDTTWGKNLYFIYNNKSYKIGLYRNFGSNRFEYNPEYSPYEVEELFTKKQL